MIENGNFRNLLTPPEIDTVYERCAFAHDLPIDDDGVMIGNRLFPGDDTPRTFINCNLVNCETPPGSTLTNCNTTLAHNRKVVDTDSVIIDGESIDSDILENWIYGKYLADGSYCYHSHIIKVSEG